MKSKPIFSTKQLAPLIEIIIAVAFFATASTILIRVFSQAHNNSRLAHDINNATLFVGECAENIRASKDYNSVLGALGSAGFVKSEDSNVYHIYFDEEFSTTESDEVYATVTFAITMEDNGAGRLLSGRFICERTDGEELVSMETAVFMPDE